MRRTWYSLALVAIAAACSTAELTDAPADGTSSGGPGVVDGADGGPVDPVTGTRDPEPDSPPLAMSHDVTIQVQPSDSGAALLSAIRGAKKSVHMTMYLLTNRSVIDALGDLADDGKDVKVVLNKDFPSNSSDDEGNQPAYESLKKRGVEVVWAPSAYTFTHAKTILVDGESAVIMTMNLTFTSAKSNREYIATDTDPDDLADLEKIFQADLNNEAVSLPTKLVVSPEAANSLQPPRAHLKAFIDSAKTSLDVEAQSLSDKTIVDAIILAHQAGVAVRVVIDGDTSDSSAQLATIEKLKQHGVPLRSLKKPDLHAKVIVVDGARAFVGSQNLTATGLTQNREVGVLTDAASEAAKVRDVIAEDFVDGVEL